MVFSSLRSRNRHSANPNPRLHTGAGRDAHAHRNTHADPHTSVHSETQMDKNTRKSIHNTHTRLCREKELSNTLWKQEDDAHTLVHVHTLRNGLNGHTNPQHGCQDNTPPQADSPPPSPHPLLQTDYRSDLHPHALPPPPPLLPAHSASSLGSPPSLVPLVVPVVEKPERCRHLFSLHTTHTAPAPLPGPAPTTMATSNRQSERKRGEACASPLTNQQRRWESGEPMPKTKPRKSSMPVKIEREKVEGGRNEEEEEC